MIAETGSKMEGWSRILELHSTPSGDEVSGVGCSSGQGQVGREEEACVQDKV